MNFVRNLTLRGQLSLLSGIAIVGVLAMTLLSWNRVGVVYEASEVTAKNTLPALAILTKAEGAAYMLRIRNWQVAALENAAARDEAIAKKEEVNSELKAALDQYEKENMAFDTPEELVEGKRLLEAVRTAQQILTKLSNQVVELMKANKSVEAGELLWNNQAALKQVSVATEELRKFNLKQSDEAIATAATAKRDMVIVMLVIGATLAGLTLLFSQVITRMVRSGTEKAVQVAEQIAQGKLGMQIDETAYHEQTELGRLLRALKQMDVKLSDIVGSVSDTAETVGSAARQISQGNDDLSSRTQEQASALEETAATMEQMTAAVKRNSDNARQADQLGRQARNQADASTEVVGKTVAAMTDISTASRKIGDIINVIDEIAFQTNLLALNAAVEAARAGEQGRGFAVVATEVRNLAQRSATAAKEIKSLIQDSMHKVQTGTELVNASGKALNDIVTDVKRVTDIVAEIAAATSEQANGIDQVNHAVTQMDSTTQQNAALVEEAASASKSMEDQTQTLIEQISFFQLAGHARRSKPSRSGSVPQSVAVNRKSAVKRPSAASVASTTTSAAEDAPRKRVVGGEQSWTEF